MLFAFAVCLLVVGFVAAIRALPIGIHRKFGFQTGLDSSSAGSTSSRESALLCSGLSLFAAAMAYSSDVAPDLLMRLCEEDGSIELAQFAAYFVAGCALTYQAWHHRLNPWLWLFGLLFLMIAGEEVSWGQRVFGLTTPQSLAAVNVQAEVNVHNLTWLNSIVRLVGSCIFFVTFALIPLAQEFQSTRRLIERLRLPVAPLRSTYAFAIGLAFMIVTRLTPSMPYGFDEVGELLFAIAALGLAIKVFAEPREPDVHSHVLLGPLKRFVAN